MKKLTVNKPGAVHRAGLAQLPRPLIHSGSGVGPRAITSRPEVQYRDEQQETQLWEKHPFLPRPSNPYLSQSQTSLSQGFRTDSQSTQRFSQNSQPEDYVCDQWRQGLREKEITSQQGQKRPPSPYWSPYTTPGPLTPPDGVGSASGKAPSSITSNALSLLGPQNSSRPWPQCSVTQELENRLGNVEKVLDEAIRMLHDIHENGQRMKTTLEETFFDSKENRTKVSLQQTALNKLLKEEETANKRMIIALESLPNIIREEIKNLEVVREAQVDKIKQTLEPEVAQGQFAEDLLSTLKDEVRKFGRSYFQVQSDHVAPPADVVDRVPDQGIDLALAFSTPDELEGPIFNPEVKDLFNGSENDVVIRESVRRMRLRARNKWRGRSNSCLCVALTEQPSMPF